ncbi:MAG: hypothetical protein R3D27_02910 [Hyphomicrobiaceae bacterium]
MSFADTFASTGEPTLDRQLIGEMQVQAGFFGVRPAFRLYEKGSHNAMATPRVWSGAPSTDGTVLYHVAMMRAQLRSHSWGGAVVAAVTAHEFAHIYQFRRGLIQAWRRGGRRTKYSELHADYLAGYYMGSKRTIDASGIREFADYFFGIGDYKFNDPQHHGTREERYATVKAAFNLYRNAPGRSVGYVSAQGEAYIREYIRDA